VSEAAVLDWVYTVAAKIDGEWGCCHSADEIRAGHTIVEEWMDWEPRPLDDACIGYRTVQDYLAAKAAP
jgi:hypothetical protein